MHTERELVYWDDDREVVEWDQQYYHLQPHDHLFRKSDGEEL
jgi:hypothetical protein